MAESIDRAAIKARATRKRIAERTGLGVDTIGESRLWRAVEPEIAALLTEREALIERVRAEERERCLEAERGAE